MTETTGIYRNSELIPVEITLGEWADKLVSLKIGADFLTEQGSSSAARAEVQYQQWLQWGQNAHAFSLKGDYQLLFRQLTEIYQTMLGKGFAADWQEVHELNGRKDNIIQRFNEIAGHVPPDKETK